MRKKIAKLTVILALIISPTLLDSNKARAEEALDPISGAGTLLEAIHDLFCPENPQNRCKHGECLDGACISFRKACTSKSDCS